MQVLGPPPFSVRLSESGWIATYCHFILYCVLCGIIFKLFCIVYCVVSWSATCCQVILYCVLCGIICCAQVFCRR
jgi:hypothetical protein